MSLFVVKQARRARRSCTSSKLSPTQRLTVEDTGDGSASKNASIRQKSLRTSLGERTFSPGRSGGTQVRGRRPS